MFHVLGVDKNFEGPAASTLENVIHRNINRVIALRPLELVGEAGQHRVAFQRLFHVDDFATARGGLDRKH